MRWWVWWITLLYCGTGWANSLTIEDDVGSTTFSQTPLRIVALTWSQTEILLTLGVTPVGVATIKGYHQWQSNQPPLPDGVTEVGHRSNPNLEAIARLRPDLILGYNFRHQNQLGRLQKIAPTLLFRQYPKGDDTEFRYFDQMQRITRTLGRLLEKEEAAEAAIAETLETIELSRQALEDHGLAGQHVVLGKFVGMGMGLRVFSNGSLSADIAQQLGLVNQWQATLPGRDFSHIQLPQMLALGNPHVIIFGDDSDETQAMQQSAIWQHLPFVKNQRLHRVANSWGFGGPVSSRIMAIRIRDALLESAQ